MAHDFSDNHDLNSSDPRRDANPYASPLAEGPLLAPKDFEPIGIWRYRDRLVMHREARLPPRCIRTNDFCGELDRQEYFINPESTQRLARVLTLIAGAILACGAFFTLPGFAAYYSAGLLGLLALLISHLFTLRLAKQTSVTFYLSHALRKRRKAWFAFSGVALGAGISLALLTVPPLLVEPPRSFLGGMAGLFTVVSAVTFAVAKFHLRIVPFGEQYLVLHGCGKNFRDSFPECLFSPSSQRRG